ncbi:glycoside hydrolase family 5 protein [Pedosphaera parvula]|uniref:Cellulase n=1 Tax=Pedosphaera parvula (strain Ellin514) TaxID=320771 RepID=B9XHW7_PEDPL|nr:glycoside hydrolase family 5 protein [Pedosphaera parvula]EEF60460.1 Cellulase [Pedosphaera parvula Ellin514]
MKAHQLIILLGFALVAAKPGVAAQTNVMKPLPYTGVNLAGGEFYDPVKTPEPMYGRNFSYPTRAEYEYFAGKGMNVFRVQFLWETLQAKAKEPFRQAELDRLKSTVKLATARGLTVILDPHNYARYYGKVVGSNEVPYDAFADFWGRLANEFRGDTNVWFGLVNEPHDMPTEQWLQAANEAIAAVRKTGAENLILVPGNGYSSAHGWVKGKWYGTSNGSVMQKIHDPNSNYVFEVHQYLDKDSSGTHREVVRPTIGSERLKEFVEWCRQNKQRAFLGEFAVAEGETGRLAIEDMLQAMERDRDVWLGFTWWAAGSRWGNYMFSLEPKDGKDRPQMEYLRGHLQK